MQNKIIAILLQNELINNEDVHQIQDLMMNDISCVQAILLIKNEFSEISLMNLLSFVFKMPLVEITNYDLDKLPKTNLTSRFILNHKLLPLEFCDRKLVLAVTEPLDEELCSQISFITGSDIIDTVLICEHELISIIQNKYGEVHDSQTTKGLDFTDRDKILSYEDSSNSDNGDKSVIKLVHKIICDAVKQRASDIHFEPYEDIYRIRYRIDGVLTEASTLSLDLKDIIIARIKVISKIDIAEKRIPQDGKLQLLIDNQTIDFRVSTLPTAFGEKIVLRILDRNATSINIGDLGLDETQQKILLAAINRPYGMILVTGPTGSGKTVTLYSILNLLNQTSCNISTIEDPIEIPITGINQVMVNEKANLDFAVALRAFLRQDPDVIMVGEIRDTETASMAVKAAQTGHLVLSTLHTNSSANALTRLLSLGVPPYNVGDAILLIVAERLVRKLCLCCKAFGKYSNRELSAAGFIAFEIDQGFMPYVAIGCEKCNYSGYKGRIGIFEVMPIDDEIKRLILNGANSVVIEDVARKNGVKSLRENALDKVRLGITSLTEIEAHINW